MKSFIRNLLIKTISGIMLLKVNISNEGSPEHVVIQFFKNQYTESRSSLLVQDYPFFHLLRTKHGKILIIFLSIT
ncbi:hypothetical protein GMMP1_1470008 [Candidatus Magnetomoraceae bacterium gMMP-1]